MKRANNTMRKLIMLSLAATLLMGCSGLLTSDKDPKRFYLLQPYTAWQATASTAAGASLALTVTAIPGLDSDRVLALGQDAQLNHYANARWPDHLPEVLTSVLQRSLESSGRFASVRTDGRAPPDSWVLQLEARAFYGIQDSAGVTNSVRVALGGEVECSGGRHAIAAEDSSSVADQRLSAIVSAHQSSLDAVTRQLLQAIESACGPGGS